MTEDDVIPPNYTAHALDDLRDILQKWQQPYPQSAQVLEHICGQLESGVKFLLPNCGLFVEQEELRQAEMDLLRLPYPVCVLEAPWRPEEVRMLPGETPFSRRIALCFEGNFEACVPGQRVPYDGHGVVVYPISWSDVARHWLPMTGGLFIPYGARLGNELRGYGVPHMNSLAEAGCQGNGGPTLQCEPLPLLPELFDIDVSKTGDRTKAMVNILNNVRDEVRMVIQMCAVLNCANVSIGDVQAPNEKLNKKRAAKGKQPFFSYKVLELPEEHGTKREWQGGTHASPRSHLRRGHFRQLPEKRIYVRHTIVKPHSPRGVVQKDYSL